MFILVSTLVSLYRTLLEQSLSQAKERQGAAEKLTVLVRVAVLV
jgi:hypothetical protein